jgi:hypothetical protein
MNTRRLLAPGFRRFTTSLLVVGFAFGPATLHAQKKKSNPASKVYVSDINGEAQIDTGDAVEDVTKRSVYTAQGTVIETKKSSDNTDAARSYSTMVYSNGTGAYFDEDTRVEVKRFAQEPFTPNRADVDLEPSISQTQAFVARGTVGLCTAKLIAGSNMTYQTAQGSVNIRGRKVVIEAARGVTKISMLEGDSTVRAGANDLGGQTLKAGEQAIISEGIGGLPASIRILPIPANEAPQLDEKVAMACLAKKTVYFDVKEKITNGSDQSGAESPTGGGDPAPGAVTAFDDTASGTVPIREIVPIEIVPVTAPVEATMTPSRSPTAPRSGG